MVGHVGQHGNPREVTRVFGSHTQHGKGQRADRGRLLQIV